MVLIFLIFFTLLVACGNHGTNPTETSRIIVENDEIKLSSQLTMTKLFPWNLQVPQKVLQKAHKKGPFS